MNDFVDAFHFIGNNTGLVSHLVLVQIRLSIVAIAGAIALGLPLGVWLGHRRRGSFIAINVGNLLRALPSLAVIAIGLTFFGIGYTNTTFALFVVGFPVILTNAYVGVAEVERDAVDAAEGMGMSGWDVL